MRVRPAGRLLSPGRRRMDWLLSLPIIDGPIPWIVYGLASAIVVALLIRRPTRRWLLAAGLGILAGVVVALAVYVVADATEAFGAALPLPVLWWSIACFAGVGLCIASFWGARAWRKVVAGLGILIIPLAGVLGVNSFYGINPTVGSLIGVLASDPIALPAPTASDGPPAQPLYETWKPPKDMPAKGEVGTVTIPATVSGFTARDAGIYLPPAALVKDAPALPVVIFMMGHPGNPDPTAIAAALDDYAAKNNGLAPIAVVPDQLGPAQNDPACADSKMYGNAETYVTTDVADWVAKNLNVIQDRRWWVIGGYSNGGGCAITFGAQYPEKWRNIIDVSGEPFPGSEDPQNVTNQIYGGSASAFEASKPVDILTQHPGAYGGMTAAFTAGADDPSYIKAAQEVSRAAKAAGMTVDVETIPGAGHTGEALTKGLAITIGVMYPVLGLSAK